MRLLETVRVVASDALRATEAHRRLVAHFKSEGRPDAVACADYALTAASPPAFVHPSWERAAASAFTVMDEERDGRARGR